jgi:HSP20 family protein
MAHVRCRSMRDIFGIQDEISRMFEDFAGRQDDVELSRMTPAADIVENKESFVVKAELPGIKKEDIKIALQNNLLTISGEKKKEVETKDQTVHHLERSYGAFYRTFELPVMVNQSKIKAEFVDGILTVELPKAEEAKPKEISISVK